MAKITRKLTYDLLTGGINNVDGVDTINSTTRNTESPEMINVEFYRLGGIQTMKGNTQIGDTQDSKVVGGWEYTKDKHKYMMIALEDGSIKEYNKVNNTFREVYKFKNKSPRVSFCNMNNGVVFSNGVDDLVFFEHNRHTSLKGIVKTVEGSNIIEGDGTDFEVQLSKGDTIEIENNIYKIKEIKDKNLLYIDGEAIKTSKSVDIEFNCYRHYNPIKDFYTDKNNEVIGGNVYEKVTDDIYEVIGTITEIDNDLVTFIYNDIDVEYPYEWKNNVYGSQDYEFVYTKTNPVSGTIDVFVEEDGVWTKVGTGYRAANMLQVTFTSKPQETIRYISSGRISYYAGSRYEQGDTILYKEQYVDYFMGEISECNAELTNSDDVGIHTPIRGTAIQYYNGRLWVGSDNGLFYSQVGQYNKWDIKYDAGVIYSIYNDTSNITALGLYSEYLMVHKEHNTYILTCTGTGETIQIKPYSNVTCRSQQSWVVSNTKYFVYSPDHMDIYPLVQRTIYNDKFLGEPLTKKVRNLFRELKREELENIFCVSYPKKRWMLFYLPLYTKKGSNVALIFDFQTKSFVMREVTQNVTCAFNYNGEVYIGTMNGKVLKEFDGKTFDGEPIKAIYKSPWFDWADGYTQSFSEFNIEIDNDKYNSFYIRTYKDGRYPYEDRLLSSTKITSDCLEWEANEDEEQLTNTVWDKDRWEEGFVQDVRMLLPNDVFDRFQVVLFTEEPEQSFYIPAYQFRRIETDEAPW